MFKHSIFLRIYAGLVILVVLVAVFGYLLVQIINYQRAQEYRESLTDGMAYIISEGVARQPNLQQKMDWVSDASDLLELPIHYVEASKVDITRAEGRRIANRKAVVRWDAESDIAYIVVGLRDDPNHYLYIKADSITERQMKALPVFILDYLVYYPGQGKRISCPYSGSFLLSGFYRKCPEPAFGLRADRATASGSQHYFIP